ncbi:MAG: hypothetical protein WBO06_12840 [Gammaproteobacteria bacterium]
MKPTETELEIAIIAAEQMRDLGRDKHHIAKSLLYIYQRLHALERIRKSAERYIHFGQEEPQHAELVMAIEAAKKAEEKAEGMERESLGLA